MTDRSSWWEQLDAELGAPLDDLPDPWADADATSPPLTAAQEAFLRGLADQPAVPRLRGIDDESAVPPPAGDLGVPGSATGSPPGDTPGAGP